MSGGCVAETADGIVLSVRVTPRGGRNGLGGGWTDADGRTWLVARVSAPPVDGAATAAVIRTVAKAFAVRTSDVSITSGATSRHKRLKIVGNTYNLAGRANALLEGMT